MDRYDADTGDVLVPINLRRDVIEPLARVERRVTDELPRLTSRLDEHIQDHPKTLDDAFRRAEQRRKDARRAGRKRALKWLGGAAAFIVTALPIVLAILGQ